MNVADSQRLGSELEKLGYGYTDQVREARGEITQYHAKVIIDFCRHERRCMLYAGWLREANEAELDEISMLRHGFIPKVGLRGKLK